MSERYKKIFELKESVYKESSPVVIKAGALVQDTTTGRLHIQLKLQNIVDKEISLLTTKFILKDAVGRNLGVVEKQYLDLNAKNGDEFAGKIPVAIKDNATRVFEAYVCEVAFADGEICSYDENGWEKLPTQVDLSSQLGAEALEEFRLTYSSESKYIPLKHKDVWLCSCGRINKNNCDTCAKCGSALSEMEKADDDTLASQNIYRKGTTLIEETNSSRIEQGIALLEKIPTWKDVPEILESAKRKLAEVKQKEEAEVKGRKKFRKKLTIILASVFTPLIIFVILCATVIAPKVEYNRNWEAGNFGYAVKEKNLTEFTIPEGTTEIKDLAFFNCDKLTSVTIPDSVTSIGDSAFSGCESLTSITLPDSVTSIGYSAFSDCESLTSITIPNGVTSIGVHAFWGCESLTSLTIPDSVTSIGDSAFFGCESLTSITLPDSVTSIGYSAFSGCSSLTSITIPNGVTSIGDSAFSACSKLTSITLPDSVTSIGDSAFSGCAIEKATIPTNVIDMISTSSLKEVVLNGGNSIGNFAFSGCSKLTSVTIGNGVTSIGNYAFYDCSSLTSVTIGNGVKSIGDSVFTGCSSLTSITLPDSVTSIGESSFYKCSKLTSIVIPSSVNYIGEYAFWDWTSSQTIYCRAGSKPSGWSSSWDRWSNAKVVWNYQG